MNYYHHTGNCLNWKRVYADLLILDDKKYVAYNRFNIR